MTFPSQPPRLSRRDVLKFFAAVAATSTLPEAAMRSAESVKQGYGSDPNLLRVYTPGDVWPLIMSERQHGTARALADVILPEDELGPSASALKVPEFIDEWVSAPYPKNLADKPVILDGLGWLEDESKRRFNVEFGRLTKVQQHAICDDIAMGARALPPFLAAAKFFRLFRSIAASAYYGSAEGWRAIGYVGNTPSSTFDGPPAEVLERLGLEQTVK